MNPSDLDPDLDFPSLAEIESARHEILARVASQVSGTPSESRAHHFSHSSGTGKGHTSTVSNRPSTDSTGS
jgi:hypothetical protein